MSKKVRNIVLLFTIALIWGLSFSAQRSGASTLAPFTFYNFRNYFAVWTMSILIIFNRKNIEISKKKESIKAGIILGVIDFLALAVQQIGIGYTTASKSSFITATYVIMVPLFAAIFGKKIKKSLWLCVFLEIVGLYLLCVNDNFVINIGDIITFVGAFFFAIHILLIEKEGDKMDTLIFCFVQYIICAILSTICMLAFEMPIDVEGIKTSWFALAYTGIHLSEEMLTMILSETECDPVRVRMGGKSLVSVLGNKDYAGYEETDTPYYEVSNVHYLKALSVLKEMTENFAEEPEEEEIAEEPVETENVEESFESEAAEESEETENVEEEIESEATEESEETENVDEVIESEATEEPEETENVDEVIESETTEESEGTEYVEEAIESETAEVSEETEIIEESDESETIEFSEETEIAEEESEFSSEEIADSETDFPEEIMAVTEAGDC